MLRLRVITGAAGILKMSGMLGEELEVSKSEPEGMVAHQLEEDGLYPLAGTITAPDGQTLELVAVSDDDEGGEYRWIVLEDGEVKGARKGVATGSSSGFIDPTSDI